MNFRAGLVKAMAVAASVLVAALIVSHSTSQSKINPATEWREYLGGPERNHYSPLKQINTSNIQKLQVAWTYNSGGADPNNRSQIQCSPIVVDGVMYATSPELHAFALDAASGKEIWKFKHNEKQGLSVNRGVVYWESGGDKRILFSAGMFLYALDARTGKPIPAFGKEGGEGGKIDLRNDLGRDTTGQYVISTTPGTIYKDLIVITTRLSEGVDAAPGHIRAYNVRTGKLAWRFNTIPQPGEFGYNTWPPEAYKTIGAANNWAGMAIDRKRGIIYVPTGSAADDFYGANRKGANLFANCLLALDAATGKRLWHFQAVHHDLFDRDFPAPPNLVTVNHNGRKVDAVAQISKQGFVYVFDRVTGKSLFPIEEKPFPASPMPGEEAWPTQPIPAKPAPLVRQSFAEADITPFSAERDAMVQKFRATWQAGSLFTPPSKQGTIIFPGFDGGAEYGGAAIDPNGVMYVNSNEMPWILTMVDAVPKKGQPAGSLGEQLYVANCVNCHGLDRKGDSGGGNPSLLDVPAKRSKAQVEQIIVNGKGWMPSFKKLSETERRVLVDYLFNEEKELTASPSSAGKVQRPRLPFTNTGYNRFVDKDGYPAIKPPWGTLSALDLNTGEYLWKVNLGELKELTARGIPPTGTENYGGPVVTAGGVVFIAATKDEMFRAFDQKSGRILWETKLPAGGYATPATYQAHGKQYVVIACGGGKMKTKSGDAYVAFALP